MSRPEHTAPPELFYNDTEAKKYTESSRIVHIQEQMTKRALELLALPEGQPLLLADIGCGSGLSGEVLEQEGHTWVGCDISTSMLAIANQRENEGDLIALDMGSGLPFRPGTLDGAVSISAVQWLCNADKTSHVPQRRLGLFFSSLYRALARGARAVFQFYPESPKQMELITTAAMKAGFAVRTTDFPPVRGMALSDRWRVSDRAGWWLTTPTPPRCFPAPPLASLCRSC